jgi:hypothetical protein
MNKDLAQKILNYLATKPYQEVYQLVGEILQQAGKQEESEKVAKQVVENKDDSKALTKSK